MAPDTAPLVRTRKLSLIDVIVGATGTAFDPETPLVLHGGLSHVGELCGLVTPPAALVAPPLLLLLAGPPAWRAVAAAGLPHDPANRSGTWRLADVLVTALLLESLVVSTLAPRLMSGELGATLRTFARVERLELSGVWGPPCSLPPRSATPSVGYSPPLGPTDRASEANWVLRSVLLTSCTED
jgi:hypothetical protein